MPEDGVIRPFLLIDDNYKTIDFVDVLELKVLRMD